MAVSQKKNMEEQGAAIKSQVASLPKATIDKEQEMDFEREKALSVINIKVPTSVKNKLKSFYAECGISLSRGLLLSALYLHQQYESGKIDVTIAGVLEK